MADSHAYVIALGSNMRVPDVGAPRAVIGAALDALEEQGLAIHAASRVRASAPIGPSLRHYANAAALVESDDGPPAMLAMLQSVEQAFARKRRGQDWRSRTLDLDIVLWSGGVWLSRDLAIPHPWFRERDFVLRPAAEVAPHWRDPATRFTLRQLAARGV